MVEAGFLHLKGRGHGEDRVTMLDRDDAAGDKTLAVADAVDLVDDRNRGIAGPQKIGVQRMRFSIRLDSAARRDEGLAQNLAAENALPADIRAATAEKVVLERLQVEDAEKVFYGGLHVRPRMVRLAAATS